jgi:hypothetical protein
MATLSIVCAVGETAAQAVGIPVAASLINEIVKACEEVGKQKVSRWDLTMHSVLTPSK